jgi:ubiquinol oxidase
VPSFSKPWPRFQAWSAALTHLKSLRRFEDDRGWIKALLDEAQNERAHLMTFSHLAKPNWFERFLVIAAQGVFFNVFFFMYLFWPRAAHRFVGYLEEEAITSYTEYLAEIDAGKIENVPAPRYAIDYWKLEPDARLREVVVAVRLDEAKHRDVNHGFADDIAGCATGKAPATPDHSEALHRLAEEKRASDQAPASREP